MREATNSNVSSIDVTVQRPRDTYSANSNVRTDEGTVNITGSGGSVTVTNNSDGPWYLEEVGASALGVTPGTVLVTVEVRDSQDTSLAKTSFDPAVSARSPMYGQAVNPGWDVNVTVTQDDSNSYDVEVSPVFFKPEPSSGGVAISEPGGGDTIMDSFESGGITPYSGNTGEFTTTSDPVYHDSTALHYNSATTGTPHRIVSTPGDGLNTYPETEGRFEVDCRVRAQAKDSDGANSDDQIGMLFGATGVSNTFMAYLAPQTNRFEIVDVASNTQEGGGRYSFTYTGDEWWRIKVDHDNSRDVSTEGKLYDDDGDPVATATADLTMYGRGFGWVGKKNQSGKDSYADQLRLLAE